MNIFKRLFRKKETIKIKQDENRYYFYNGKCSIKIDKNNLRTNVEKYGKKHTLLTKDGYVMIIEIRKGFPDIQGLLDFDDVGDFKTKMTSKLNMSTRIMTQYYYVNCDNFVIQFTTSDTSFILPISTLRVGK